MVTRFLKTLIVRRVDTDSARIPPSPLSHDHQERGSRDSPDIELSNHKPPDPSRIVRVATIVLVIVISLHWIGRYWVHTLWSLTGSESPPSYWQFHLLRFTLALLLVVWTPRACGLCLGRSVAEWRFVVIMSLTMILPAIGFMSVMRTPFYGVSAAVWVLVPPGEEFIFRGFLFALVAHAFPRVRCVGGIDVSTATIVTAVAFGIWHLGGFQLPITGFIWFQVLYTTIAGILIGILRDRTQSLWPCVLVHWIVDWWAVNVPDFI